MYVIGDDVKARSKNSPDVFVAKTVFVIFARNDPTRPLLALLIPIGVESRMKRNNTALCKDRPKLILARSKNFDEIKLGVIVKVSSGTGIQVPEYRKVDSVAALTAW